MEEVDSDEEADYTKMDLVSIGGLFGCYAII